MLSSSDQTDPFAAAALTSVGVTIVAENNIAGSCQRVLTGPDTGGLETIAQVESWLDRFLCDLLILYFSCDLGTTRWSNLTAQFSQIKTRPF